MKEKVAEVLSRLYQLHGSWDAKVAVMIDPRDSNGEFWLDFYVDGTFIYSFKFDTEEDRNTLGDEFVAGLEQGGGKVHSVQ